MNSAKKTRHVVGGTWSSNGAMPSTSMMMSLYKDFPSIPRTHYPLQAPSKPAAPLAAPAAPPTQKTMDAAKQMALNATAAAAAVSGAKGRVFSIFFCVCVCVGGW